MEAYDKGKESGKKVIASTISKTLDNIETKDGIKSLFTYLWGVRDAYTDILSTYMQKMIPIDMPDDISDTERSMYWELSSYIMAYYNTINEQGVDQYLVDKSVISVMDIIIEMAKSQFSHEVYMGIISAMRDHLDEVMVKDAKVK